MRRYVLTKEAESALDSQIDYLIAQGAQTAAQNLLNRIHNFLADTLCQFPATGRHLMLRDLWEIWIPGTRQILWYRFDEQIVTVIATWHTSQNRSVN